MSTTSSRRTKVSSHDSQDLHGSLKDKPPLPYTVGAAFTAYRHKPPAPFGHGYDSPWPPFKTGKFWLPQLDYCLSQSPLPGHTLKEYCTLAITDLIRTGYTYNAQVVVVNKTMVAKIYDPLYDNGFDCYDNKRDVIVLADGDYSREAAAYETLQRSSEARNCIPDYYGSWTIQGWVEDDIGAANEWLWECFREREEYVPVVRDEDREECPRLVEVEELTGCNSKSCITK
ncbi:conserved hypothetical protein [Pyrenophora tritici-repentis Pt-1C-BFP]|uniref:Uncharacterized protein n=1 Tax=Pyrenophora tritici-repentis (strain Pt-1C-BFP) TaxID=426418 RepID=B2VYP4_PYRTR|nr:uncharacterized protein PTRG_02534 [Pyrenophora tritici-repentis Pt-1C-BFP]EDU45057.1 conserved hypothetical protein [Pyrenophora tritici-repentis Pt-1C-BFP]